MTTYTDNLGLAKPADDETDWGSKYRASMDTLDGAVAGLQAAVAPPAPTHLRLDYGTRTDTSPVYLGKAPADAAETDPVWEVTTFLYASGDPGARLLGTEVRTGIAWTDRAA